MTAKRVYRLCREAEWEAARRSGALAPDPADAADGFVHLSGAGQVAETAKRHYAGARDLMVLEIDAGALGDALVWEASRGGAVFPHLYALLPVSAVLAARPLGQA